MATDTIATGTAERDGKQYQTIREGKATILVPQGAKVGEDKSEVQQVFYNPIQQFNRDLSVLAIKTYGEEVLERRHRQFEAKANKKSKKRKRASDDDGDQTAVQKTEEQQVNPDSEEPERPAYKPSFRILDALAASGLRGLRYAHELPFVTSVTANDLSPSAAKSVQANVVHNGLEDRVKVTNNDALALMYRAIADDLSNKGRQGNLEKSQKWDVIDLDPYGTGAPFFDAAIQSVKEDGGLLCITCTDSAVWAGHSYCEKTYALYGGIPIKGIHSHEAGLRLILHAIASSGARHGLHVEPLLSLSIDFYTKFFVRVTRSPQAVKFQGAKTMLVYSCDQGCGAWQTQFLMKSKVAPNKKGSGNFYKHGMAQGPTADQFCQHCGSKTHINGPMYGGHLHDPDFVTRLLEQIPKADTSVYGTIPRLEGMLRTALEEYLPEPEREEKVNPKDDAAAIIDPYPFYVVPGKLAGIVSCPSPPDDLFRGALFHLGYRATRSHCRPGSIKTDAPWSTIWWIMTEWIRQKAPIKASKIKSTSPAWKILKDAGLLEEANEAPSSEKDGAAAPEEQDSVMEDAKQPATSHEATDGKPEGKPSPIDGIQAPPSEAELRKTLVFDDDLARLGRRNDGKRIVRYQMNPERNWGPLNRAKAQ